MPTLTSGNFGSELHSPTSGAESVENSNQFPAESHSPLDSQSSCAQKEFFLHHQNPQQKQQPLSSRLPSLLISGSNDSQLQHFQQQQLTQSVSEPTSPYQNQHQQQQPLLQSPQSHSEPGSLPANQQLEVTTPQSDKTAPQSSAELQKQQQLLLHQVAATNIFRQNQFPGSFFWNTVTRLQTQYYSLGNVLCIYWKCHVFFSMKINVPFVKDNVWTFYRHNS